MKCGKKNLTKGNKCKKIVYIEKERWTEGSRILTRKRLLISGGARNVSELVRENLANETVEEKLAVKFSCMK